MRALSILGLCAGLVACGGGNEVHLTIQVDPAIDAPTLALIKSLEIAVLGTEPSSVRYPITTELADRTTTWLYKAKSAGSLQFEVVARGDGRKLIATGKSGVLATGSTVSATVLLGVSAPNPTRRRLGQSCTTGVDTCASGFCVDGVCCDSACAGSCNTCNGTRPGTCAPALPGTNPRKACTVDTMNPCGLDGTCDGQGQCRVAPVGKICAQPTCASGMLTSAATCDGAGACSTPTVRDCAPYACNAMNTACSTICTTTAGCAPSVSCQAGSCGKVAQGGRCFGGNDCQNGTCIDGYCCESTCMGACKSCKEPGHEGSCVTVAAGTVDPHKVCVDAGSTSCGQNGKCDAMGACANYAAGTLCAAGSCSGDATMASAPSVCVGDGSPCPAPVLTACAPYHCATDGAPGCDQSCGECTYYDPGMSPPFMNACASGTTCMDHCLQSDARFVCQ